MVYCPNCGTLKVKDVGGGDKQIYKHPSVKGVIERFIMILCEECGWSWNIAGAKQDK